MQLVLTSSLCRKLCFNLIKKQPKLSYLIFDCLLVFVVLFGFHVIYRNHTAHLILQDILHGLESSQIGDLSLIESFQIFLLYRLSLILSLLHLYNLIAAWFAQRLGLTRDPCLTNVQICLTLLGFVCSFWLPNIWIDLYSKIAFVGSLAFLLFQIFSCTRFLFDRGFTKRHEEITQVSRRSLWKRLILLINTITLLLFVAYFLANIWSEMKHCKKTWGYISVSYLLDQFLQTPNTR